MIINKSLVPGTCHNSLIDFYVFVSYLSLGNFLLFILCTCKSQYDVIFDRTPCTMFLSYIDLDAGYSWSMEGEVGNSNIRMASNFLFCTYNICCAYRKLILVMPLLFLASVVMFFQTVINLFLLKSYFKFHSFRVHNVLLSFLCLII